MSGVSALTAAGGGGVGWQVDLPGLASLVLNLGASGLKRFAEAGVDFHTILCMGEIAEKCPASNEYWRELSVCRQAQRKQAQWLYKVVEIGAATNFVADELLKKRAGENVIALMSAILPVMSESSCDNLLLKLFESCDASLDKTPGFGQLRSLRESLTPLARKTQFKDRAFQYHVLSRQLLDADAPISSTSVYHCIPNEETAVLVILALSKLMREDQGHVLAYHGLTGAGWVIAYARHVLGLSVCVLKPDLQPVPISGDFSNAKVLVYLHKEENRCELLLQRNVQELFVPKGIDSAGSAGWLIDVNKTNLLNTYTSIDDPLKRALSIIARSMTEKYVQLLAGYLSGATGNPRTAGTEQELAEIGLTKYPIYCIPNLRRRARKILKLLGFDSCDQSELRDGEWSNYVKVQNFVLSSFQNFENSVILKADDFAPHLVAGPTWIKAGLGHFEASPDSPDRLSSKGAFDSFRSIWFKQKGIAQLSVVFKAVEIASWLAFTDWDEHVQLLSTSFVDSEGSWNDCMVFGRSLIEILDEGVLYERNTGKPDPMATLCKVVIDISIGGRQSWTPDFSEERMLAFQHWGIVFVQNAALHQTLDLESSFLHIVPGAIVANGERQNKIYTYSFHQKQTQVTTSSGGHRNRQLRPVNLFPDISISSRLEISGEDVILQQTALVRDKLCAIASPGSTCTALANLYVTKECDHDYYATFEPKKADRPSSSALSLMNMKQGLHLAGSTDCTSTLTEIWLQAVDQSPHGQWLAYQDFGNDQYTTILQRGCCIECTYRKMVEVSIRLRVLGPSSGVWRIVHGRLAHETTG